MIKEKIVDLFSLASVGAVVGGIVAGMPYKDLSTIVMMLEVVIFYHIYRLIIASKISNVLALFYFVVFALFSFQWATIQMFGAPLYPSIWWIIHSLNCVYIFYLIRIDARLNN